jgi:hypothetical protein
MPIQGWCWAEPDGTGQPAGVPYTLHERRPRGGGGETRRGDHPPPSAPPPLPPPAGPGRYRSAASFGRRHIGQNGGPSGNRSGALS